jgi:hypothetical protein
MFGRNESQDGFSVDEREVYEDIADIQEDEGDYDSRMDEDWGDYDPSDEGDLYGYGDDDVSQGRYDE